MRRLLAALLPLHLLGCSDDRCSEITLATMPRVGLRVYDAATLELLAPVVDAPKVTGLVSLACPGLATVSHPWLLGYVDFAYPGPEGTSLTCTVSVEAPGYVTWTKQVQQTWTECGVPSKGYVFDVLLQPAP